MGKRVTAKDVARRAGVSAATVSYVLNDNPTQSISPETRKRVQDAIRELQYAPNMAAKALRRSESNCVGVVIKKNLTVPRFSQMLEGIQEELEAHGYNIMLCGDRLRPNGYVDYLNLYLENRIDGVIYLGTDLGGPDEATCAVIERERLPFVAFDCEAASGPYATVNLDYAGGAREVAESVFAELPRKVLYLRPQIQNAQETQREQGVREVAQRFPSCALEVAEVPITSENLDVWDVRYSHGATAANHELVSKLVGSFLERAQGMGAGDAVVCSWSSWIEAIRAASPVAGLTFAELASNGEALIAADYYTRLPNVATGALCAKLLLEQVEGKPSRHELVPLSCTSSRTGEVPAC